MKGNFQLLLKYLRGDATLDERLEVMNWARCSEENRKELETLRRIYEVLLLSDCDDAAGKRKRSIHIVKWIASAAVAAAVAAGVWFFGFMNDEEPQTLAVATLEAPVGHQTMTVLNDGTQIRLNSGSRLEVIAGNGTERRVNLHGEAYFDVARNPDMPFVVTTSGMEVKVLGTEFNVTAYDENQTVVLVEGQVEARPSDGGTCVTMHPDQLFGYNAVSGETSLREVDVAEYTSWTEGYVLLKSTPVSEIFTKLEHYFRVEIVFPDECLKDVKVSGKFMVNDGLETALGNIALLVPVKYEYGDGGKRITVLAED